MMALTRSSIYDPLADTPREDLFERYRELLADHPVYHNVERDVWCISRHEAVLAAARDWEAFTNVDGVDLDVPARFFGSGDFLDQDPPRHDLLRDVVRRRFSPRNVKAWEAAVEERVDGLLDRIEGRSDVDLAQEFAWRIPMWVICRVLGIADEFYDEIHRSLVSLTEKEPGANEPSATMLKGLSELRTFLAEAAQAKRTRPADDVLSDLILAVDDGRIDLDELVGISLLLFVAGSETAASLISTGLHLLDLHPDQKTEVRRRVIPLDRAIEEIVRYEAPLQYLARTSTRQVEVEGVAIPPAARVILLYGAANRDPRRYVDPDGFLIGREPKRHLGFGNGIHFCLGAPLARLEARIAFDRFFDRIGSYEVTGPPTRLANHMIRGVTSLPARMS
jgi:cytochrome P450